MNCKMNCWIFIVYVTSFVTICEAWSTNSASKFLESSFQSSSFHPFKPQAQISQTSMVGKTKLNMIPSSIQEVSEHMTVVNTVLDPMNTHYNNNNMMMKGLWSSIMVGSSDNEVVNGTTERLSDGANIAVFVLGCIPFLWATIEFWRRIAVGASFGTGKDSVIIGKDGVPSESRGRRVLGKDALVVAYILFAIAGGSIGLAIASVISSSPQDIPPNFH